MLRVRSLLTGRPVAELAFAEGQRLRIDEIFLIRRGSGALMGHWPVGPGAAEHDRRVSGVLTAINEVATEAFEAERSALRRIDLGNSLVLFACLAGLSPGRQMPGCGTRLCRAHHRPAFRRRYRASAHAAQRRIRGFRARGQHAARRSGRQARPRNGRAACEIQRSSQPALACRGARLERQPPAGGLGASSAYSSYATGQTRGIAERVIAAQSELNGYPVHVGVERRGAEVSLLGLVPTVDAAREAVRRLKTALPLSQITDRSAALPRGDIEALQVQVGQLSSEAARSDAAARSALAQLGSETSSANAALHNGLKTLDDQIAKANGATQSGIEALHGALIAADKARHADVEALRAELARAVAPSARARLETWTRTHAIFFTKDTGYRDPQLAAAALDELAKLIKETDVLVRVVGFTDEKGGQERNVPLSQARATRSSRRADTTRHPGGGLVAVGRNNIEDLSPVVGDASPNRRVEFEIGLMVKPGDDGTKIMLLGEIGVGKSSIAQRLVFNRFGTDYKPTLGVDVYTYEIETPTG